MPASDSDKLAVVRALVSRAPDAVIQALEAALAGDGGGVLEPVYAMVRLESADRARRNVLLKPVVALFRADGRDTGWLRFPPSALREIWAGLKHAAPDVLIRADAALVDPERTDTAAIDAPARLAGQELRAAYHPEFAAAARICDAARPQGAADLAACLDLASLVRPALDRLPGWIANMDGERIAVARLMCRDAAEVSHEAEPRVFEMLAAQLAEPWRILRVISAVTDHPGDGYLAGSELAGFGERILDAVDAELAVVSAFVQTDGPSAGAKAAEAAGRAVALLSEIEQAIALSRDGPWGRRVTQQKRRLSEAAEARLGEIDDAVLAALPFTNTRRSMLRRAEPLLVHEPDETRIARAMALLRFAHGTQGCAAVGGFSAVRMKTLEKLEQRLDGYVQDTLERVRSSDTALAALGRSHLAVAADFYALVRDEKAGDLVRRRMAAAA